MGDAKKADLNKKFEKLKKSGLGGGGNSGGNNGSGGNGSGRDGRNDFTRGQEIVHGTYRVGHEATPVTVRASTGDMGDIHAVKGGPFRKSHTTSEPDGSFHHHGEHAKGKGDPNKNKVYTNKGKNAILSLWKTFNRKS